MNPISARILLVIQMAIFIGGLVGMLVLLHKIPDSSQLQREIDARMAAMP